MTIEIKNTEGLVLFTSDAETLEFEFDGYDFQDAVFSGLDLREVKFANCNLQRAKFIECDLEGVVFKTCSFLDAVIEGCDCTDTDFRHSDLRDATFRDCKVLGAYFDNTRRLGLRFQLVEGGMCQSQLRWVEHICSRCECDTDGSCDCSHCEYCGEPQESTCPHCSRCDHCCHCTTCERCGEECSDTQCAQCSEDYSETRCEDCCRGHRQDAPGTCKVRGVFPAEGPQKDFKCTRLVGIEIEYNKCEGNVEYLADWIDRWKAGNHTDGSCGYEIVTAPMAGDNIAKALDELSQAFDDSQAEADDRCGVHVHVDANDFTWADTYRFLWVYGKLEPLLYILAGQQRVNNSYCSPVGSEYLEALRKLDRKGGILSVAHANVEAKAQLRHRKPCKKSHGRYRGLNICPWVAGRHKRDEQAKDTTFEFRLHRNCLDGERLTGWAQVCARIVDWCAKASDKEAQNLPKSPLRALCDVIAPDCKPFIMNRMKGWRAVTSAKRNGRPPRRIKIKSNNWAIERGE